VTRADTTPPVSGRTSLQARGGNGEDASETNVEGGVIFMATVDYQPPVDVL
jgi:hypothetical protein